MIRKFHEGFDRLPDVAKLLAALAMCFLLGTAMSPPSPNFPLAAGMALLFPVLAFGLTRAYYLVAPERK